MTLQNVQVNGDMLTISKKEIENEALRMLLEQTRYEADDAHVQWLITIGRLRALKDLLCYFRTNEQ